MIIFSKFEVEACLRQVPVFPLVEAVKPSSPVCDDLLVPWLIGGHLIPSDGVRSLGA
jgi:hypothetical protein